MDNIVFPAEWYPQDGVMITWPHTDSDWFDILDEVTECYVSLSKEIVKRQKLVIVCNDEQTVLNFFTQSEQSNITTCKCSSNDTWARDHGPISVFVNRKPTIFDFGFNGWGLKFTANHDNQITQNIFNNRVFDKSVDYKGKLDFILEGGAIESDGQGTLMTTTQCLLAPNRNQPMTKEDIEKYLINTFGLKRVLWINYGYLSGDDTDSHIDTLVRFCDAQTIAYVSCDNESDQHFEELKLMEQELKQLRTTDGSPYKLIPLPMAEKVEYEGNRLPATYANFLITNDIVLLPVYKTAKDNIAISQLQKAFPNHEIVGIDCRPLIKQHGSLHCITMQIPKGFL